MKCSNCREAGHNQKKCPMPLKKPVPTAPKPPKQPSKKKQKESANPLTQQANTTFLMHNRGVGVYTYPSGFQRQATMINFNGSQSSNTTRSTNINSVGSLYHGPTQLF